MLVTKCITFVATFGLIVSPIFPAGTGTEHQATGKLGMVSTAHPAATEAGLAILRKGGNAFDAAVAIAATLNVVEPQMSGIGGYGTIVIYDARERRARFLNASGRIPGATNADAFRAPTPGYLENRRGAKAVSTPGNVGAWEALWKAHGSQPWASLFQSGIAAADQGFVINAGLARQIKADFSSFPPHAQAFYGRAGKPLEEGERLVQKDLAGSLRMIALRGAKTLQGGELGWAVDRAMKDAEGFLSISDLTDNQAEWSDPIKITYRGFEVITASPPANAFDALVRLGIMESFDLAPMGHNSAEYLHLFAEVTKHGFWVRLRFAGDPDVNPPPLSRLLSSSYWASEAARIDLRRATPFSPPQHFYGKQSQHTTHFVVADRWGNVVSATQTLGNTFGSKIMPPGTGIWLNNSLAYCTFEPKGNPMDAHAGRRKLSGDCPTIIMRHGRPWAALGTPGGHTIGQTVPQIVMNLIDFKMGIQQAIDAPRISFVEPDQLAIEESIALSVRNLLIAKGHKIRVVRALGNAHGVTIEYGRDGRPKTFHGGADSRGEGKARGY